MYFFPFFFKQVQELVEDLIGLAHFAVKSVKLPHRYN